ncbi:MAG: hypothetical protein ACE5OQ_15495, partial [Woeseia sp.]
MKESNDEARFADSATLGAPDAVATSEWVVMKFGGTSVSCADNWQRIAERIQNRLDDGFRVVIVHSALKGVSNALEEILFTAISGDPSERFEQVRQQHYDLADTLGLDGHALLDEALKELGQLISGVRLVHEVSLRVRVRVMALGEIMATRLGAAYLEGRGIDAHWQDAKDILTSETRANRSATQSYLSATCPYDSDPDLAEEL